MRTITRACAVALLLTVAPGVTAAQATISPLLITGPPYARINIVLLSEGYTQQQLPRFQTDAGKIVTRLLLFAPFQEYANSFNAYAIAVASQDSGADHPLSNDYRNTFFNSTYNSFQVDRLLTIPPNDRDPVSAHGAGRVDSLLEIFMPEFDLACVVVNDPVYGGSGGGIIVVSTNSASAEIAIHELGHGFGRLGDEYESAYPGYPDIEEPNTTRETRREFIKWNRWILESTPLPTPAIPTYGSQVGLFEGAHYHATGWYRPKLNCMMRALANEYCEVCRQQLVLSMYRLVRPIESYSPLADVVNIRDTGSVVFSVTPVIPASHALSLHWFLDSISLNGENSFSYIVHAEDVGNGMHTVRANVFDSTVYVRSDPTGLLRDSVVWTLNVSGATAAGDPASPGVGGHFTLSQNFPNPFNPSTTIEFSIPCESRVTLELYNLLGEEVLLLFDELRPRGTYRISLNGSGAGLASGVYFCRMEATTGNPSGRFVNTRRLVLLK